MATTTEPVSRRPAWQRLAWRGFRLVAIVYLVLLLILYRIQGWLIFPGAAVKGGPDLMPPPGAELLRLDTPGGEKVAALFGRALGPDGADDRDSARRPSLIYFYGNGMCLRDAVSEFQMFRSLGVNVLAVEYVGYGLSTGQPSESGCYDAAEAAYQYLVKRPDVDPGKVAAAGWSLGGAVAIELAARHKLAGLATFSTFTSMTDMAQRMYPFLPVSWLLKHRFESRDKLRNVRCPILIGHSTDDSLVPYFMAGRLAEAAGGPVTRLTIRGADHNEFFAVNDRKTVSELTKFLEGLSRTTAE